MKAFVIGHEIGHHVLQHTGGVTTRVFPAKGDKMTIEVDQRALACEYEADSYGFRLLQALFNTTDETVFYAYCKYKFDFAPLLLFDIFRILDQIQERRQDKQVTQNSHPHPDLRIKALVDRYHIDSEDPLYLNIKSSLDHYLGGFGSHIMADRP